AKLAVREPQNDLPDGDIKILPIATETAAALFVVGTFAGASARLIGITWGAEDLSAELGARANRDAQGRFLDPYRLARSLCLAGAAAASVPAIDTVFVDFRNDVGFRRECEEACRDGFVGKMAIHPAQVLIINEVFSPSADAIAHAQSVIAAFAAAPGAGVVGIGGVMYDPPHLVKAKQLLARAPALASSKKRCPCVHLIERHGRIVAGIRISSRHKRRLLGFSVRRLRIEGARVAKFKLRCAQLALRRSERHGPVETGTSSGMAG